MAVEASQLHDPAVELEATFGEARGAESEGVGVVIDDAPVAHEPNAHCVEMRVIDIPQTHGRKLLEPYCVAVRFRGPSPRWGRHRCRGSSPRWGRRRCRGSSGFGDLHGCRAPCNHALTIDQLELQDESPRGSFEVAGSAFTCGSRPRVP